MRHLFPQFKKLSLEDKAIIESHTKKHLPYSDFNFVSLYTWNTDENTLYSMLEENLVICMKDYTSDKKIFSFLGKTNSKKAIATLIEYARTQGTNSLTLIPEETIKALHEDKKKYHIEEDRDQFDYIFNLEHIASLEGRVFKKQRNMCKNFETNNTTELRHIDIRSPKIHHEINEMLKRWKTHKIENAKHYDESEFVAIKKYLTLGEHRNLINLGLYLDERLIGFSFFEAVHDNYAMFHYEKTDHHFRGITEYIKKSTAQELVKRGLKFLNGEQDLGLEGLRKSKELWNPIKYLKKYTITPI